MTETKYLTCPGIFRAPQPGAAKAVLQQLAVRLRECADEKPPSYSLLSSAVSRCQAQISSCSGLSGCLAIISDSTLTYWSIGTLHPSICTADACCECSFERRYR